MRQPRNQKLEDRSICVVGRLWLLRQVYQSGPLHGSESHLLPYADLGNVAAVSVSIFFKCPLSGIPGLVCCPPHERAQPTRSRSRSCRTAFEGPSPRLQRVRWPLDTGPETARCSEADSTSHILNLPLSIPAQAVESLPEPSLWKLSEPNCSYSLKTNQARLQRTSHLLDRAVRLLPGQQLDSFSTRQIIQV